MTVADELCDRVAFVVDGEVPLVDAPKALKLAHGRATVRVEYRRGGRLEVREFRREGLAENEGFHELLRTASVETIHTAEATLEEVFLDVTGQELV
jgi:fluoroquinolone transport system ATP-binding protein